MKYFICEFKDGTLEILEEVEYKFIEQCNGAISKLNYYSFIKSLHQIWINNTTSFLKGYKSILKKLDNLKPNLKTPVLKKATLDCNTLVYNYLASFRTMVDKIQETAQHMILGKDFVKNILNKFYDENPEYAFIYKLRNYAVHYNIIFNAITVDANHIEVKCTKDHLMKYDDWNKVTKEFILNFSDTIPIYDCIDEVSVIIEAIYQGFIQYFCEDVNIIDKNLAKLIGKYKLKNPRFVQCENIEDLKHGCTILGFSVEQLMEFVNDAKDLPGITFVQGKCNQ